MKIIIGGILGGLIVVAIVIWFPVLSDTEYEITEKETIRPFQHVLSDTGYEITEIETIHPCQQVILDYFDLYKKLSSFDRASATLQQIQAFNEKYEDIAKEQMGQFDQKMIEYNCKDTASEWATQEFKGKLEFLMDYGFLP